MAVFFDLRTKTIRCLFLTPCSHVYFVVALPCHSPNASVLSLRQMRWAHSCVALLMTLHPRVSAWSLFFWPRWLQPPCPKRKKQLPRCSHSSLSVGPLYSLYLSHVFLCERYLSPSSLCLLSSLCLRYYAIHDYLLVLLLFLLMLPVVAVNAVVDILPFSLLYCLIFICNQSHICCCSFVVLFPLNGASLCSLVWYYLVLQLA